MLLLLALLALIAAATAEVHRVPLTKVPRVRQSRTAFTTRKFAADLKNGDDIIINVNGTITQLHQFIDSSSSNKRNKWLHRD